MRERPRGDGSSRSGAQAEHVAHVVEAGGAGGVGEPDGGAEGPAREGVARGGAVGDLDALPEPEEEHGVVADDISAAQGLDADLARGARADLAVAVVARGLLEIACFAVILILFVPFAVLSFQLATDMQPFLNSAVPLRGPVMVAIYVFTVVTGIAVATDL